MWTCFQATRFAFCFYILSNKWPRSKAGLLLRNCSVISSYHLGNPANLTFHITSKWTGMWYTLLKKKQNRYLSCFLVSRMFRTMPFNIGILSHKSLFKFKLIWSEDLVPTHASCIWAWCLHLARSYHTGQGRCRRVHHCRCSLHIALVCLV